MNLVPVECGSRILNNKYSDILYESYHHHSHSHSHYPQNTFNNLIISPGSFTY